MARLTKVRHDHSSDEDFPDVDVLLTQASKTSSRSTNSAASKPSTLNQDHDKPTATQGRRVRRLGGVRNQDLDNPLLQRWDTGENDDFMTVSRIRSDASSIKIRSRVSSRTQPPKAETCPGNTQQESLDLQRRTSNTRRPRIPPELADSDDDDDDEGSGAEEVPSLHQKIRTLQTQQDKCKKPTSRSSSSTKHSAQTIPAKSGKPDRGTMAPTMKRIQTDAGGRRGDVGNEDEDSVYQTANEPVSDDSDGSHSDFTPDDSWTGSREKPSARRLMLNHRDEAKTEPKERLVLRAKEGSKNTLSGKQKEAIDADLANTFSQLRLQLLDFSDEDSHPPRTKRPSTPPRSDQISQPKALLSPKKQPLIPRTPHKSHTDAFWSQDVVDDWNDKHSPRKPIFAPKPVSSPVKLSPSKQQKKSFVEKRQGLAEEFLKKLDQEITQGRVGELAASTGGVRLIWSKTLNTTAGRANWKREAIRGKQDTQGCGAQYRHHASIELAEKVLDSEDRLHNTLAHEFCHLATFMLDNVTKNPHGSHFQAWGAKCTRAFGKSHGIEVTTKHSYAIDYKYIWQCGNCQLEFKRHSKSIDPVRHRCGGCKGVLAQIKPVPRKGNGDGNAGGAGGGGKLSEYQIFMKEQMKLVREENPGSPQKEVMRIVAERWAKKNGKMKGKTSSAPTSIDSVVDQLEILTVED